MSGVTQILSAIDSGDPAAAEQLLPLLYEELRRLAGARLAAEPSGNPLQPTALVQKRLRLTSVSDANSQRQDDSNIDLAVFALLMQFNWPTVVISSVLMPPRFGKPIVDLPPVLVDACCCVCPFIILVAIVVGVGIVAARRRRRS
jgi:hypothetical protein